LISHDLSFPLIDRCTRTPHLYCLLHPAPSLHPCAACLHRWCIPALCMPRCELHRTSTPPHCNARHPALTGRSLHSPWAHSSHGRPEGSPIRAAKRTHMCSLEVRPTHPSPTPLHPPLWPLSNMHDARAAHGLTLCAAPCLLSPYWQLTFRTFPSSPACLLCPQVPSTQAHPSCARALPPPIAQPRPSNCTSGERRPLLLAASMLLQLYPLVTQ